MDNQQRAENAIKWIETLLDTDLPQGFGKLGDRENGFCCLGVACETLRLEFDSRQHFLSDYAAKSIGLASLDGEPIYGESREDYIMSLPELNDSEGWDFSQIGGHLIDHCDRYFLDEVSELIKKHFQES